MGDPTGALENSVRVLRCVAMGSCSTVVELMTRILEVLGFLPARKLPFIFSLTVLSSEKHVICGGATQIFL